MYNESLLTTNETSSTSLTPLFIIGNGDANNNRSNAMVVRKNGSVELKTNITVQNGKGIIRNTDGTQSKKVSTSVTVTSSFAAGETKTFPISWGAESFSATPEAYVGNIVSGSGGWAEVIMSIADVTSTGATLFV